MKRYVVCASLCGSLVVILTAFGFFGAALRFLIVGDMPFGYADLTPSMMLSVWTTSTMYTIYFLIPRGNRLAFHSKLFMILPKFPKRRYKKLIARLRVIGRKYTFRPKLQLFQHK